LGAADQRAPEYAGAVAELVEQLGIAGKAHTAEQPEQFLAAVRDQDAAERDPQDRFCKLLYGGVDAAERGHVKTRCRIGHFGLPLVAISSTTRLHRTAIGRESHLLPRCRM